MTPPARRVVDLSHVIEPGMITDPRLPAPRVYDVWTREQSAVRYASGVSFQIAAVDVAQNTGTYIDTPFHRFEHDAGRHPGVWDIPPERVADLPGVCIDFRDRARGNAPRLPGRRGIAPDLFAGLDLRGRAVLVCTGMDAHWGTETYRDGLHPHLTAPAARALADAGAALFGFDALNADDFADLARPAHTILLGAGIPIVENLRGLTPLIGASFRFTAAPAPIRGLGSFPVRAIAVVGG